MSPKKILLTLLFCLVACGVAAADIPASTSSNGMSTALNYYKKIQITHVDSRVTNLTLETRSGEVLYSGLPKRGDVFDLSGHTVVKATGYMRGRARSSHMNAIRFRTLR